MDFASLLIDERLLKQMLLNLLTNASKFTPEGGRNNVRARFDHAIGVRLAVVTILESYPRATFAVIDRADHGWPLDTPDLLAALMDDDWLMRIAERGA